MAVFSVRLYDDAGRKSKLKLIEACDLTEAAEQTAEPEWTVWSVRMLTEQERRQHLLFNQLAILVQPSVAFIASLALCIGMIVFTWESFGFVSNEFQVRFAILIPLMIVFVAVFWRARKAGSGYAKKAATSVGQREARFYGVSLETVPGTLWIWLGRMVFGWPALFGGMLAMVVFVKSDQGIMEMNGILILGMFFFLIFLGDRHRCITSRPTRGNQTPVVS